MTFSYLRSGWVGAALTLGAVAVQASPAVYPNQTEGDFIARNFRFADGATLSEEDAGEFFEACFRGEPTPAQVAAALTAMRMRGETVGEITASARAMRKAAVMLEHPFEVMDVCGTGGSRPRPPSRRRCPPAALPPCLS